MLRQDAGGRNVPTILICDKGFISRTYQKLLQIISKPHNYKQVKVLNTYFPEGTEMNYKFMKMCPISLVIKSILQCDNNLLLTKRLKLNNEQH